MEVTVTVLVIIGVAILSGLGIVGSIAPALPGPPLNYAALLLYHFGTDNKFSTWFLVIALVFVLITVVVDYLLPPYMTKKYGGTKWGVWGGIIGLLFGFLLGPWGILIGPLLGAIIGDLVAGKQFESALKSGFGSFVGFLLATAVKLAVSITLTVILIWRGIMDIIWN